MSATTTSPTSAAIATATSPIAPVPTPASVSYAKIAKKASNDNDVTAEDPTVEATTSNHRANALKPDDHGPTEPR
jgi:hypothetical protein